MKRIGWTSLALAAVLAAGGGGYWAGYRGMRLPDASRLPTTASAPATSGPSLSEPIIYYRDPDGKPFYAAVPRKTAEGRYFLGVRASEDVSFEDKAPAPTENSAAEGTKRILYYRNPMGLPDTSPVPKKDAMGMDYIAVLEGESEDGSIVRVSPGKLQRTGVRSETVTKRVIVRPVRAPGTVQLDERRISVVATRSDAFVDHVENVTTGDRVRKGQPLVRLYSPDIAGASALYLANMGFEGARRRLENLNVPAEVIADIERTHKVPPTITWTAPRDGVVLERNVVEGMKAAPGDVLFRLADTSTMWVLADVPEYDLGMVLPSASVTIRVRSLPGRTFSGSVGLIYPQVSKETRTTRVRIEIPNPDSLLLPDMYADVEIATGDAKPVVAVPDSAVIDTGTRQVALLDRGEGRFEPREVKIGRRGAGLIEITDGLAEGDKVVVAANFLIDAESNLKAALRGLTTEEGAP